MEDRIGSPDKNYLISGVIGLVFSLAAAAWSFIGGACCGWGGWPLAIIGLIAASISLYLKRNIIGWIALGLAIFAFAWVFIGAAVIGSLLTGT